MSKDDDVGYGKPPKASQFKPGKSGNPKGRPPKSKNAATLRKEAFNAKVLVTENGKPKRMSKREASYTQYANKSAAGIPRFLLDYIHAEQISQKNRVESDNFLTHEEALKQLE